MWKHGRCAKGSAECAEVRFGVWCLARRRRVANAGVRYDIAGPLRGAKRQTPNAQLQTPNPDHFNPHPCDGFIFSCVVKIKQHLMKNWALFFAEKYFSPSVRPWKIRAGTPGAKCPPVRESGSKNHREATWPANRVCRSDPGGTAAAGAGRVAELGAAAVLGEFTPSRISRGQIIRPLTCPNVTADFPQRRESQLSPLNFFLTPAPFRAAR